MLKTGKPESVQPEKPTAKPTATATAASRSRSRAERVVPEAVRRREYDNWDNFENDFEDVESLGETEYDETI